MSVQDMGDHDSPQLPDLRILATLSTVRFSFFFFFFFHCGTFSIIQWLKAFSSYSCLVVTVINWLLLSTASCLLLLSAILSSFWRLYIFVIIIPPVICTKLSSRFPLTLSTYNVHSRYGRSWISTFSILLLSQQYFLLYDNSICFWFFLLHPFTQTC